MYFYSIRSSACVLTRSSQTAKATNSLFELTALDGTGELLNSRWRYKPRRQNPPKVLRRQEETFAISCSGDLLYSRWRYAPRRRNPPKALKKKRSLCDLLDSRWRYVPRRCNPPRTLKKRRRSHTFPSSGDHQLCFLWVISTFLNSISRLHVNVCRHTI